MFPHLSWGPTARVNTVHLIKGLRDSALLALLLGAGLRRSEVAAINTAHIQERDGRWLIADLVGKHGRIRSVPITPWAHAAVVRWQAAAGISAGPVFRRVTRHGTVAAKSISPQAVFELVKWYAKAIGVEVGPHDARRTFAQLAASWPRSPGADPTLSRPCFHRDNRDLSGNPAEPPGCAVRPLGVTASIVSLPQPKLPLNAEGRRLRYGTPGPTAPSRAHRRGLEM